MCSIKISNRIVDLDLGRDGEGISLEEEICDMTYRMSYIVVSNKAWVPIVLNLNGIVRGKIEGLVAFLITNHFHSYIESKL